MAITRGITTPPVTTPALLKALPAARFPLPVKAQANLFLEAGGG